MIKNNPTNVEAAFEMLLEEIEAEIAFINNAGAKGFEARDYDRAREALEQAASLTGFREKVADLRREWVGLQSRQPQRTRKARRRALGRLGRGLRTREEAYFGPILSTLIELGGTAKMADVLPRVEKRMKGILKKVDYEPLASNRDMPRWKNTAQWARNTLVRDGLMKSESRKGVWEISDAGKDWVAKASGAK
jgi:hypothetical protein